MDFYVESPDSVQNTALKVSLVSTLILWIIFTITAVAIPASSKKDEFSTINIILDTPPEKEPEPKENKTLPAQEQPKETVKETKTEPVAPVQEQKTQKIQEKPVEKKPVEKTPPAPAQIHGIDRKYISVMFPDGKTFFPGYTEACSGTCKGNSAKRSEAGCNPEDGFGKYTVLFAKKSEYYLQEERRRAYGGTAGFNFKKEGMGRQRIR